MSKGDRKSGSKKRLGSGNPAPTPAIRGSMPEAMRERMAKAVDFHGKPYVDRGRRAKKKGKGDRRAKATGDTA